MACKWDLVTRLAKYPVPTRRLLTAKQLLADTDLPITQVALLSGFASVRRINAAFAQHYPLNPKQMRRQGIRPAGDVCGAETIRVRSFVIR